MLERMDKDSRRPPRHARRGRLRSYTRRTCWIQWVGVTKGSVPAESFASVMEECTMWQDEDKRRGLAAATNFVAGSSESSRAPP